MDDNDDHNASDWQDNEYTLEESFKADMNTPAKSFGDLSHHNKGKESENYYNEPSSQFKRRRMLHFDEEETLNASIFGDEVFLRSEETSDSLDDAIADMSNWVATFADDEMPASNNECFDPSAEGWISDCFVEPESQLISDDSANGAAEVQLEIAEVCETQTQLNADNRLTKLPIRTRQRTVLKGTKAYMRTPMNMASSVVYPFTFIKPCAARGDMTLNDINKRILTPRKPKAAEIDLSGSVQTSAFSGKPVVGTTKIRTEGGEGSITILRTKG